MVFFKKVVCTFARQYTSHSARSTDSHNLEYDQEKNISRIHVVLIRHRFVLIAGVGCLQYWSGYDHNGSPVHNSIHHPI